MSTSNSGDPKNSGSVEHSSSEDAAEPAAEPFDAVKAAEELAASLGMAGSDAAASEPDRIYAETLELEVEELNFLIDKKDTEIATLKAKVASSHAEIGKASERIVKEERKKVEKKSRKILLNFLEVLDDFDRAFAALRKGGHSDSILDGLEIVHATFLRKLGELGVTHQPALDQKFDPKIHEAVSLLPVDEPTKEGHVVAVVREGYALADECLRPAKVAVGKHG